LIGIQDIDSIGAASCSLVRHCYENSYVWSPNSKFEYRNPKQIQMTEIQNFSDDRQNSKEQPYFNSGSRLGHLKFEFV